ncbi:TIGR04283 family arsenosugar biosynthesis glycosyltransferase [Lutibaculum baratangense]|uniref:Glycosyl transferase, group 2 family protein n=1 Tax=Lutibaculum baratangense AMV1 TaxID=631454 RepID=V4RF77_9HYPH|nr:TIGR04283 family arsenosugar biosynthesis glycosyltransferase [Lutibaculum baratangense]ESR24796.1 Glycosyl transferase, group 2 family protein [Lutibaculum baratangense AMV1]
MLSVVVPTLNSERGLTRTLTALVVAAAEGVVSQVVVVDGGSTDRTIEIAEGFGCDVVQGPRGRGTQLALGARAARHPWLMFLHSDTVLEEGWHRDVAGFVERQDAKEETRRFAGAFRFALDDDRRAARALEALVAMRCFLLALPYGDQGLVISARHYARIGGFREMPLMEDVDLVRRIGRRRLTILRPRAVTSAERYRRDGYLARAGRNLFCLSLFYLRVPPRLIARLYG